MHVGGHSRKKSRADARKPITNQSPIVAGRSGAIRGRGRVAGEGETEGRHERNALLPRNKTSLASNMPRFFLTQPTRTQVGWRRGKSAGEVWRQGERAERERKEHLRVLDSTSSSWRRILKSPSLALSLCSISILRCSTPSRLSTYCSIDPPGISTSVRSPISSWTRAMFSSICNGSGCLDPGSRALRASSLGRGYVPLFQNSHICGGQQNPGGYDVCRPAFLFQQGDAARLGGRAARLTHLLSMVHNDCVLLLQNVGHLQKRIRVMKGIEGNESGCKNEIEWYDPRPWSRSTRGNAEGRRDIEWNEPE